MGVNMTKRSKFNVSSDLKTINKNIESDLKKARAQDTATIKLLLLGSGECGKSTILKQMRIIHSNGFTPEERESQKFVIYANIIQSMSNLLRAMEHFRIAFEDPQREMDGDLIMTIADEREAMDDLTFECGATIKRLWNDRGVQKSYERRSEFQLHDSAKYFFDKLDSIMSPDYVPSQNDVLRARMQTTRVIEFQFTVKRLPFRVFDVGGQKTERKKWIHCFDNVNAIIFISAISEYDQVLREDNKMNRLYDSISLFESVCNLQFFKRADIILFLNKKDLLEEKISRTPLKVAFPDYTGSDKSFTQAVEFIRKKFEKANHDDSKTIYNHVTCATDTNQVSFVISSTTDMIINSSLREASLD